MSAGDVEIVRRALQAWNDGDATLSLALADPDIEVEVALGSLTDGVYRGHNEVIEFMTEFWGTFGTYRTELVECLPIADDVLLGVRHTGIGTASGVDVEMPSWQVFTVRSGKIVRWRNFRSRADALEAAGLPG